MKRQNMNHDEYDGDGLRRTDMGMNMLDMGGKGGFVDHIVH